MNSWQRYLFSNRRLLKYDGQFSENCSFFALWFYYEMSQKLDQVWLGTIGVVVLHSNRLYLMEWVKQIVTLLTCKFGMKWLAQWETAIQIDMQRGVEWNNSERANVNKSLFVCLSHDYDHTHLEIVMQSRTNVHWQRRSENNICKDLFISLVRKWLPFGGSFAQLLRASSEVYYSQNYK